MAKRKLPLGEVYKLLEPGPVLLVTTALAGRPNVMTMSWQTMIDFEPPIVACVISNRNYTFDILRKTKECAINVPTVELARKVVGCGNTSGRDTDKFKKFGLTPVPASQIGAPLIDECYANIEFKVIDTSMAGKYNLFMLEGVEAWIDRSKKNPKTIHHCGEGVFVVDGRRIKLPSKMK